MRTIDRCRYHRVGMAICCFSKVEVESNGLTRVPECNCLVDLGDEYNLYPECETKDGMSVWLECEPVNPLDPYTIGNRVFNFESLSHHNTMGNEFSLEGSKRNPRRFVTYDHYHPLYHLIDFNAPMNTTQGLSDGEIASMSGGNTPFLVSERWHSDGYGEPKKAIGKQRVSYCRALYGTFNKKTGVVEHRAMKDWYAVLPSWKNYTKHRSYRKKKPMNVFTTPWETIETFCQSYIKDDVVLARLLEAYMYVQGGTYINISSLLANNKVREQDRVAITNTISTKNPKSVYVSTTGLRYNVQMIKKLYLAIRDGRISVPKDYRIRYLANIVDYILNDEDGLGTISPRQLVATAEPIKSRDKYWYAIDIIKSAIYNERLLKVSDLPNWFRKLILEDLELTSDEEYEGIPDPCDMPAPSESVHKICNPNSEQKYIFRDFVNVCKVITRITKLELESLWKYWVRAHEKDNPDIFWKFVRNIDKGEDVDDICHIVSLENATNFASEVLDHQVDDNSFEIEPKREGDSLIWDTRDNIPKPEIKVPYEMMYERPYMQLHAIKKGLELPEGAGEPDIHVDDSSVDVNESMDGFDYTESLMYHEDDEINDSSGNMSVDGYVDDEFLGLRSIDDIQKGGNDG